MTYIYLSSTTNGLNILLSHPEQWCTTSLTILQRLKQITLWIPIPNSTHSLFAHFLYYSCINLRKIVNPIKKKKKTRILFVSISMQITNNKTDEKLVSYVVTSWKICEKCVEEILLFLFGLKLLRHSLTR